MIPTRMPSTSPSPLGHGPHQAAPARRRSRRALLALALPGLALALLPPAGAQAAGGKPFKVVTTFTVIADMARNVAGDAAVVESITKPGAEIHDYQPTPGDLVRAQGAQLVLWNGLNLERWFEKFFKRLKNVPGVVVTEGITPIPIADGPYAGKPNPHAWMSPTLAVTYVDNIARALAQHDPANASTYQANAAAYKKKIEATMAPMRQQLSALPQNHRWLVSSEGAFSYLARDFGLKELYLWPINADQQGTPRQVRHVIDEVRAHKIPTIFSESTVSPAPAEQVARETGIRYGGVLYVDSLSAADGPVPTYLDLLRVTTETVAKGLAD
ncbi:MAG: metal ABC transporter substrate-binding protein [Lautropia sp.]|nr:metal ABC transporter substrate-binding protein [Lautropia sp.]